MFDSQIDFFCLFIISYLLALLPPASWNIVAIVGPVREFVCCDDPEYQWVDKIRASRASNTARLNLLYRITSFSSFHSFPFFMFT